MTHAVVTGGAGFIGSHICARLLREGVDVTIVDNLDPYYDVRMKRKNLAVVEEAARGAGAGRFRHIDADVCDPGACASALGGTGGVDVVFHEAAQAGVRPSVTDPFKSLRVNVQGTLNMLVAAREAGVARFINASSSSVYGRVAYLPFDEAHPTSPVSPYGVSKLAAEHYCRVFWEVHGLPTVSLRYFTVYGPRMRPDLAIPRFCKRLLTGRPPVVFGDGEQSRDYTFIDDIVEANMRLLDTRVALEGQSVNVGSGRRITINDLLQVLRELTGSDVEAVHEDRAPGDASDTWASYEAARALLGYEPSTRLEEGLNAFLEWFRSDSEARELTL